MTETIHSRPYQNWDDFRRVRDLLIETYPLTPTDFNWEIRRWEGWHAHRADASWQPEWSQIIRLWETDSGKLVGAAHPEDGGDVHLEIHPDYRHLIEEEMLIWAESHLAAPAENKDQRQLLISVFDYDAPRQRIITRRGYEKTDWGWVVRRMRFGKKPLPTPIMAEGYTLRTVRPDDESDWQRMADLLNAAFNRTFHTAQEWGTFAHFAPSFRADLHLVAIAPDDSFAAHVGLTYDEANWRGIFEPVCTHPDHRRLKLAQTLMFEGLHRIRALGAADVYVGTGDSVAANELYESIGFTEAYRGLIWRKTF